MNFKELIKNITPLYNRYKAGRSSLTGIELLEISWEVGNEIKKYLEEYNIAPHALYRQIYGKSEQSINTSQKSYITREFLGRAYRIRNIFLEKKDIIKKLPSLKNFNLFREAMPFFDNQKYILTGDKMNDLLNILNSKKTYKQILSYIRKIQRENIGIKNPRDQRLNDVLNDKKIFINFYNFLYQQFKEKKYAGTKKLLGNIDPEFIDVLSRNAGALVSDDLKLTEFSTPEGLGKEFKEFGDLISKLVLPKDAKVRRRFRRLIPPEKMMRLSEMIYSVRSEDTFNKFHL